MARLVFDVAVIVGPMKVVKIKRMNTHDGDITSINVILPAAPDGTPRLQVAGLVGGTGRAAHARPVPRSTTRGLCGIGHASGGAP